MRVTRVAMKSAMERAGSSRALRRAQSPRESHDLFLHPLQVNFIVKSQPGQVYVYLPTPARMMVNAPWPPRVPTIVLPTYIPIFGNRYLTQKVAELSTSVNYSGGPNTVNTHICGPKKT